VVCGLNRPLGFMLNVRDEPSRHGGGDHADDGDTHQHQADRNDAAGCGDRKALDRRHFGRRERE